MNFQDPKNVGLNQPNTCFKYLLYQQILIWVQLGENNSV